MKYLTQKIRKIISGNSNILMHPTGHPFDYIKTRKGILRELMISKESGNLIGLISPALGEGMFFIRVLHIESQNSEEGIAYQKYDVSDRRALLTARLAVKDIHAVCPFIRNKVAETRPSGLSF